ARLRVHTRNLCQPRRRVLFSCLILSFDRPVSVQNQNVSVAQIDLCDSRSPNWEAHPTPDLLCPRGLGRYPHEAGSIGRSVRSPEARLLLERLPRRKGCPPFFLCAIFRMKCIPHPAPAQSFLHGESRVLPETLIH